MRELSYILWIRVVGCMRIYLLECSRDRSPTTSDEHDNLVKEEVQEDTSVQSPVQSKDSSTDGCAFCCFFLILCWLFISSLEHHPGSGHNNSVMLVPCPDPVLAGIYENLPLLPYVCIFYLFRNVLKLFCLCISRVCEIRSFSGSCNSMRTNFADKFGGMAPERIEWVDPCICLFTSRSDSNIGSPSDRSWKGYFSRHVGHTSTPLELILLCCASPIIVFASLVTRRLLCVSWPELSPRVS
jgi:hypothetical protein